LQKKLIYFVFIIIISCYYLPEGIGEENKIIVMVSEADKEIVEPQILDLFSHIIHTPQPETEFSITFKNPWDLDKVNKYSNLIIVSLDFPVDTTGDLLMSRIAVKNNQHNDLFVLKDLFATKQTVCAIHTVDAIALELVLNNNKKWILNEFRNTQYKRIKSNIYQYGKNSIISRRIKEMFDYSIHLQPDYNIIKFDSLKPFIWIGRGMPYRWITLHKSSKDIFKNSISAWPELERMYSETLPNIQISSNYRNTEIIFYNKENRHLMRGIYEHEESESGGPFFVYIFDTETDNEVILVSGFINYPGHNKILLLKQLEMIAFTLHKGDI